VWPRLFLRQIDFFTATRRMYKKCNSNACSFSDVIQALLWQVVGGGFVSCNMFLSTYTIVVLTANIPLSFSKPSSEATDTMLHSCSSP
jgi:hypothetical protein